MIKKIILLLFLMVFFTACTKEKHTPLIMLENVTEHIAVSSNIVMDETISILEGTPEYTIEQYYYAYKTENYELAKACFIPEKFHIPGEVIHNIFHGYKIIDKYIIGENKTGHLYTIFPYERLGLYDGDVQIVVKNYIKPDKHTWDSIYMLKKIDNKWLIYSYTSNVGD